MLAALVFAPTRSTVEQRDLDVIGRRWLFQFVVWRVWDPAAVVIQGG